MFGFCARGSLIFPVASKTRQGRQPKRNGQPCGAFRTDVSASAQIVQRVEVLLRSLEKSMFRFKGAESIGRNSSYVRRTTNNASFSEPNQNMGKVEFQLWRKFHLRKLM